MSDTKKLVLAGIIVIILTISLFFGSKSGKIPFTNTLKISTPTPTKTQTDSTITIENYTYSPANLVVKVGDTVTWVNNDTVGHTATSNDGAFDTGLIGQANEASVTFDKPGTYSYHCTPHPQMTGTIVVE